MIENAQDILTAATSVVTIASIVANHTETDKDDKAVSFLGKLINFFAGNFFRVKSTKNRR